MAVPGRADDARGMDLGSLGAWFGPHHDDPTRIRFAAEAEALGYGAVWLGVGRESSGDLRFFEDVLDATSGVVVASAIVNVFNNDPTVTAAGYRRIEARHPGRFLLGVGVGHPESISTYRKPYSALVEFLDVLDAGGVPASRRVLGALGDRSLRLARDRSLGAHPYLTVRAVEIGRAHV